MEEELDLTSILETIKKWAFLIILFMILGLAGAFLYNSTAILKYQSKTTLYVEPSVSSAGVDYQGILTNQKMVQTYAEIIKSRRVINKVIENLNLNLTYEELMAELSLSSATDTQIITVAVKDSSPVRAANIANEVATVLISDLKENMKITNIKVIDEAIENEKAVEPRKTINMLVGLTGGMMVSLLLVFIFEASDRKITTHEDIKKYLNIKTLGIIPLNSIDDKIRSKKGNYVKPVEGNTLNIKILSEPNSLVSESVRMIRTNLDFADLKLINVTSTMPSEGKSEFITNLASSFALLDKKVLVVDCDLRKPKVHRNFGLQRGKGLSNILLSKGDIYYKNVIQKFVSNKVTIDILSAGAQVSNPSELINSKAFDDLLKELKEEYDLVLLDCPPVSNLTDGILVSKLVDGTVYVIESDRVDRELVSSTLDELRTNGANLLGTVLTQVDVKKEKRYGYKYNYYYSNYNQ